MPKQQVRRPATGANAGPVTQDATEASVATKRSRLEAPESTSQVASQAEPPQSEGQAEDIDLNQRRKEEEQKPKFGEPMPKQQMPRPATGANAGAVTQDATEVAKSRGARAKAKSKAEEALVATKRSCLEAPESTSQVASQAEPPQSEGKAEDIDLNQSRKEEEQKPKFGEPANAGAVTQDAREVAKSRGARAKAKSKAEEALMATKRSRFEAPESTSQVTSQAEPRQSEGKAEGIDLQRRKEEEQKRKFGEPMPKQQMRRPATGANAGAVTQDATEALMATKRSRLEAPKITSDVTSQAEPPQSEGKAEDIDLEQHRKEEEQKRTHDVLTFRQQLRDTSFRQRNEDVKNLVADERIFPHPSPANPSASSSVPSASREDEKGGGGVSSSPAVGNLEALWLGIGTEVPPTAPEPRTSSPVEVEKSTVEEVHRQDQEDLPEKVMPDNPPESTMEPLPKEPDSSSESAAEMELLEELPPPETAQLGPDGDESGTREAHGEGSLEKKDVEQGDPLPSDQAPEDPKSTQQDQGGQVFPDEDQSHQDLHQDPHQDLQDLQFQSDVHHQQELFEKFEADDSNSKAPFPDITPRSASESHFPWDADELEAPAVDPTVGNADNDVTVDPPAAKRRKGPKRHDEAWDPAEDSSGEEQPEAWKSHAEENSDDEVAERLWRREVEVKTCGGCSAGAYQNDGKPGNLRPENLVSETHCFLKVEALLPKHLTLSQLTGPMMRRLADSFHAAGFGCPWWLPRAEIQTRHPIFNTKVPEGDSFYYPATLEYQMLGALLMSSFRPDNVMHPHLRCHFEFHVGKLLAVEIYRGTLDAVTVVDFMAGCGVQFAEEATGPAAPEMLIEEEEDWDPEATVEQAPAAPSTWVSMEDDERVDDVDGIPEPLKQMNSDLLEFGRSVCLGNLKNMCIVNLEEWPTFYEDMQEDLEQYCSKFGEVLFVGAEKKLGN
eukprot:symbB.v1.2.032628.t1/scaffold3940.1/size47874/2